MTVLGTLKARIEELEALLVENAVALAEAELTANYLRALRAELQGMLIVARRDAQAAKGLK